MGLAALLHDYTPKAIEYSSVIGIKRLGFFVDKTFYYLIFLYTQGRLVFWCLIIQDTLAHSHGCA